MPLKKSTEGDVHALDILNKVQNIPAFPLLWADENAELDEENADMLKSEIVTPIKLVDGFSYFMLVFGMVLVVVSWAMVLLCRPNDGSYYA